MNGMDKITQRLTQDLQRETDALREKAESQARDILKDYALQAQREEEELLRRGEREAKELEARLTGAIRLEENQARLAVKQEMLDAAFALALDKLCALEGEEKLALLAKLALGAVRTGKETLYLSDADRETIGQALADRLNAQVEGGAITLAGEGRPIRGGLILEDGPIETNCSFESLLNLERGNLAGDIVRVLFPKGG